MIDPDEELRLCIFVIGEEYFAIDIMRIREIVRPLEVTPVPGASDGVEGLIDLRGEVLPLFDLRRHFNLAPRSESVLPKGRFLITRIGARQMGIAVDQVVDVVTVCRRDMRTNGDVLTGVARHFFVGVVVFGDDMAMLLNLHRVLSEADKNSIDALQKRRGASLGK